MPKAQVIYEVVGGRFQLVAEIGAGGQASVHLARDLDLGIDVVLKSRSVHDEQSLVQLRREARVLMGLVPHRCLPTVRSDLVDHDRYILISDYVHGRDLASVLASQGDPGLELPVVIGYLEQVADALDHLHDHRPAVIHGDIKPANLLLADDGRVVIIDFGTALRAGESGERIGTPGFTAPEVIAGDAITPAADVYSLAAVTITLLSGADPAAGARAWHGLRAAQADGIERVLRRALAFDPARRPSTAGEFIGLLRQAAEMEIPAGTVTVAYFALGVGASLADRNEVITTIEDCAGQVLSAASVPKEGVAAVFARVSDAATVAFHADASRCAIGLHVGDLGGWHGATVQQLVGETVQLTQTATPGSVVCSPPTRMLLGRDGSHHFAATRFGFRVTVASSLATPAEVGVVATNDWVAARRAFPVFGRDTMLADVRRFIGEDHHDGRPAMVVLVAEPGIGKTRTLAELAARAVDAGDHVLVGCCSESGGAFEPFLRALGEAAFDFASGRVEWEEEGWIDRRRFFARVASTLETSPAPVTLVIDDLHWIDGASVALLSHLLTHLGSKLTVLAACRKQNAHSAVSDLFRQYVVRTIELAPLQAADLGRLAQVHRVPVAAESLAPLYALTSGNPFFALQVLDHLRGDAAAGLDNPDLPQGVLDWVGQRVSRLGTEVHAVLAPAAVIGRRFDVLVLAEIVGAGPLEVLTQLELAVEAGLLIEEGRAGEFRFTHAIVQTALLSGLSATRRALLHAKIGQQLETGGDDFDVLELAAHHWLEAGRLGNPVHAGELSARVATLVLERLAHERAHSLLERASAVLALSPPCVARDAAEANLRLVQGRAYFFSSEMTSALEELFLSAELADKAGEPETYAEAALAASMHRRHGAEDPALLALLESAGQRCPEHRPELRAMLHVRRSRLLPASATQSERVAVARHGLDDVSRMTAIHRCAVETEVARACWGPDDAPYRASIATRHISEAEQAMASGGPPRWAGVHIEALNQRSAARLQLGDLHGALADARAAAAAADEVGSTFLLTRVRMGEALILATLGQHGQAESLSEEMLELSHRRHNLVLAKLAISFCIARDQGRQGELAELQYSLGALVNDNPLFLAAFALVHAEAGSPEAARCLLDRLPTPEPCPRNWLWLGTTTVALEAAVLVGDHDTTRRYSQLLAPFSGHWALAAAELACFGPVDRVLGAAAFALGDDAAGWGYLQRGREQAAAQGAQPWVQRSDAMAANLRPLLAPAEATVGGPRL